MTTKRIYTVEEVELQGWKQPIKIHPLTIKKMRKVIEYIDSAGKNAQEDDAEAAEKTFLDVLLEAVAQCMETFEPKLADADKLGDHIDMDSLYFILEIATGIKLNDPNLQAAIATQQATVGKS